MLASGVLCLVSLDRSGINNGAGESRGVVERMSFLVAVEVLQRGFERGAAKGLLEEEEDPL
jgi:hypothetical protein